jgi:hypothetical protein
MRIVSKFVDYYDSVQRHGQDLSTVYVRNPEIIEDKRVIEAFDTAHFRFSVELTRDLRVKDPDPHPWTEITLLAFYPVIVAVAGKVYRAVQVYRGHKWHYPDKSLATVPMKHFYSVHSLEKFLATYGKSLEDICIRGHMSSTLQSTGNLRNYLSQQGTSEVEHLMCSMRIPIVVQTSHEPKHWRSGFTWEANSSLGGVGFQAVMDSFTAYQELDMYISGVLGQQAKETISISDKDRVQQHGFDEYSFRKAPGGKRSRR